jgi:hypothetical protein
VHELRHQDASGRFLLRLRRLRQHQRLQLVSTVRECHRVPVSNVRTSVGNVPEAVKWTLIG